MLSSHAMCVMCGHKAANKHIRELLLMACQHHEGHFQGNSVRARRLGRPLQSRKLSLLLEMTCSSGYLCVVANLRHAPSRLRFLFFGHGNALLLGSIL